MEIRAEEEEMHHQRRLEEPGKNRERLRESFIVLIRKTLLFPCLCKHDCLRPQLRECIDMSDPHKHVWVGNSQVVALGWV